MYLGKTLYDNTSKTMSPTLGGLKLCFHPTLHSAPQVSNLTPTAIT